MSPYLILNWAYKEFSDQLWLACSFGKDSMALLGLLRELKIEDKIKIFWINTGYDFPETIAFKDQIVNEWNLDFYEINPSHTIEEFEKEYGQELYKSNPSQCCYLNKVAPMLSFFEEYDVRYWISGLRRDESPTRKNISILELENDEQRLKINPLANWTRQDTWNYLADHHIPYNPLYDKKFKSLGCMPCSQAGVVGRFEETDERAGRWAGTDKEGGECGINILDRYTDVYQSTHDSKKI